MLSLEPIFLVRSLTGRDQELAGVSAANPIDMKHMPQVAVAALIEGAHKPDAGLDSRDPARPIKFVSTGRYTRHRASALFGCLQSAIQFMQRTSGLKARTLS